MQPRKITIKEPDIGAKYLASSPLWGPPLICLAQSRRSATLATRTHIAQRVFEPQATHQGSLHVAKFLTFFGKSKVNFGQKWASILDFLMICAPYWPKLWNHSLDGTSSWQACQGTLWSYRLTTIKCYFVHYLAAFQVCSLQLPICLVPGCPKAPLLAC